ncbi:MAG: endonuclease [Bacteroidota bacterium]
MIIRRLLFLLFFPVVVISYGQIPTGYYNPATGLTGTALQQALHNIIDNHTVVSYNSLWNWYKQTDKKSNGKVWDMYSDVPGGTPPYEYTFVTDQCGSYAIEGDCYNREHSWPKSWFNDTSPMNSDIFHIYPTDGKVNGMRDNYPYGKVGTASWTSMNGGKLGSCVTPGYSGIVFEPRDDFKGDFARTYFYMETRYYNEDAGWAGSPMTSGAQLLPWAQAMMLQWSLLDPVSQKEINRNDSIYKNIQHNRNPFIDHPEYAGLIWAQYMPQPSTYSWNVTSGNWSSPTSWTPARIIPVSGDILIFDGALKPVSTVTVDFTSAQVLGRLRIINNASVTLTGNTAARAVTIGVTGAVAPQLEVAGGSTLTISGANPVTINLPAGYSGSVAGTIVFQNAAHLFTATDVGSIVFNAGSLFTAGSGFSGTPFGTTAFNSVYFSGGSVYSLESGLPPFGAVSPNSVVVFQPGSVYKHKTNSIPSLSGRIYSDFVIDAVTFNQTVTTGSAVCAVDNFTVANAILAGFDFPGGVTIKGNLLVNAGTLRFNPAGGLLKFNGSANQVISGTGNLEIGTNCDVTIDATSTVILNKNLNLGKNINILPGGKLTVNAGIFLTVEGEVDIQY